MKDRVWVGGTDYIKLREIHTNDGNRIHFENGELVISNDDLIKSWEVELSNVLEIEMMQERIKDRFKFKEMKFITEDGQHLSGNTIISCIHNDGSEATLTGYGKLNGYEEYISSRNP